MKTECLRCKSWYETTKGYCRPCYELSILKGQCLNASVTALAHQGINPDWEKYPEKVYELAKKLFEEGKGCPKDCKDNHAHKQRFIEW